MTGRGADSAGVARETDGRCSRYRQVRFTPSIAATRRWSVHFFPLRWLSGRAWALRSGLALPFRESGEPELEVRESALREVRQGAPAQRVFDTCSPNQAARPAPLQPSLSRPRVDLLGARAPREARLTVHAGREVVRRQVSASQELSRSAVDKSRALLFAAQPLHLKETFPGVMALSVTGRECS